MALPGGRKIVVDGKNYEWIVKDKRNPFDRMDDYGNELPDYDKMVTVRADESGKLIQRRYNRSSVTPELVAELIKESIEAGRL